jgi:splicing factor 3B subunit 2
MEISVAAEEFPLEIFDIPEDEIELKEISDKFYNTFANSAEDNNESEGEEEVPEEISITHGEMRRFGRPTITVLNLIARRAVFIESHDTNIPGRFFFAEHKNVRNNIPVPSHWSQKRHNLNFKKGSETPRYRLPKYLETSGISQMRAALQEIDDKKWLWHKFRDRTQGKSNDFEVSQKLLYDAFYRNQTKPSLTRFGDVYFEGKEFMPNKRLIRPGKLSNKLMEALWISERDPPPWL